MTCSGHVAQVDGLDCTQKKPGKRIIWCYHFFLFVYVCLCILVIDMYTHEFQSLDLTRVFVQGLFVYCLDGGIIRHPSIQDKDVVAWHCWWLILFLFFCQDLGCWTLKAQCPSTAQNLIGRMFLLQLKHPITARDWFPSRSPTCLVLPMKWSPATIMMIPEWFNFPVLSGTQLKDANQVCLSFLLFS